MRPRLSVARLLGLVGGFGVGFAALISPSPLWARIFFGGTLAALAASLVGSAFARGRRRAYWRGYAACGWTYFAAVFAPGLREDVGPLLPTTPAVAALYRLIEPEPSVVLCDGTVKKLYSDGYRPAGRWPSWTRPDRMTGARFSITPAGVVTITPPRTFRVICHCLLTLAFGSLGGALASRRHDLGRLDEASPAPSVTLTGPPASGRIGG
jgi:hypothetical protein